MPEMPDVTLPLPMLPTQRPLPGCCGSDCSCAVPAARGAPAPVPQRKTPAAACHRRPFQAPRVTSDNWGLSEVNPGEDGNTGVSIHTRFKLEHRLNLLC